MSTSHLFEEFDKASPAAWKQKIQVALKGADYQSSLVWTSPEGIATKPFYTKEDAADSPPVNRPTDWVLAQGIGMYKDEQQLGFRELKILVEEAANKGAETLWIQGYIPQDSRELDNVLALSQSLHFQTTEWPEWALTALTAHTAGPSNPKQIFFDPLGYWVQKGNWPASRDKEWGLIQKMAEKVEGSSFLGIDLTPYGDCGGNAVEQLAAALLHTKAYAELPVLKDRLSQLSIFVAVGGNYFYEIAKLSALRALFASRFPETEIRIMARPGLRNKTLYDYNVNLLRSCSECMAAVLGGADLVFNMPYDAIYGNSNDFGHRIARNQLLLLKHESGLHAGYTKGSYYVEALTKQLADKAQTLFQRWENEGGFFKLVRSGRLQKRLAQSAQKEQQLFDQGELVLIGTNKYPNPEDKMGMYKEALFPPKNTIKTDVEPLPVRRLAFKHERQRHKEESAAVAK